MKEGRPHVGFVSTRLAGTDGVSLEAEKWCQTLRGLAYECFFFAGECEAPPERSLVVPEAHFTHPEIEYLTAALFSGPYRPSETSRQVEKLKNHLKQALQDFVLRFDLDLLVAENALSLPVNIPLGLALTELIAEIVLAMRLEVAAEDIMYTIHAHPTLTEALHEAALSADNRSIHGINR